MSSWEAHVGRGSYKNVNGIKTFYLELGRGHPLLLIHGWGSSSFSWRRNYTELAKSYRVVAVDLPGFGMSAPLPGGLHLNSVSTHLYTLLDELEVGRFNLIGHSMGGVIAAYMAAQKPDRVTKLVLVSPSLLIGRSGRRPFFVALARNRQIGRVLSWMLLNRYFVRRALRSVYSDPSLVDEETVEGYYRSIAKSGKTLLEAFNIMEEFSTDLLEKIRCSVLFLLGEKDTWVPVDKNKLIAEKIKARLAVIPGAGHSPHEESPQDFNKIILEFLGASD